MLGFGLFSVKGIFSLCELHYCGAAHNSVTVQGGAPLFWGVEVVVFQVRDESRMVSTSVCRCTLFNNVDIRDQFLEKWDSTTEYSD